MDPIIKYWRDARIHCDGDVLQAMFWNFTHREVNWPRDMSNPGYQPLPDDLTVNGEVYPVEVKRVNMAPEGMHEMYLVASFDEPRSEFQLDWEDVKCKRPVDVLFYARRDGGLEWSLSSLVLLIDPAYWSFFPLSGEASEYFRWYC